MSAEYEIKVHQLRSEYIDAAIAELTAVCNAVQSTGEDRIARLRQDAEEAGQKAQSLFEQFIQCVNDHRATQESEN
jgi:hypothetical protein